MTAEYKSLEDKRLKEYNIMALYDVTSLQKIVEALRLGFLNKEMPKINDGLVKRARGEVQRLNSAYDAAMYGFAQALYRHAFLHGTGGRNVDGSILGISGSIEGKNNIEHTVLAFDLGPNPWEVYKGQNLQRGKTLDTVLVEDKANLWLMDHLDELHGFNQLKVERSRIFFPFFGELNSKSDIFFTSEGLNLDTLVPYLMWTGGYVGHTPVTGKYPTRADFEKMAPQSISYRLKNSLRPRLAQLVVSERGLFQDLKETLADWAAIRVILEKEGDVYQFMAPFFKAYHESTRVRIGTNYLIDIVYIDDRYGENKKPNGFQDFKMAIRILPARKAKDMPESGLFVEMLTTDKMSFFNHDIDEKHPAHHIRREDERELLIPIAKDRKRGKHVKNIMSNVQAEIANYAIEVFDEVFDSYIMTKDIDALRK